MVLLSKFIFEDEDEDEIIDKTEYETSKKRT